MDNPNWYATQMMVEVTVTAKEHEAFELFCARNRIPAARIRQEHDQYIYMVRDGLDYIDIMLYLLKVTSDTSDPDVMSQILLLLMNRYYLDVQYDYENYSVYRDPQDYHLLCNYV